MLTRSCSILVLQRTTLSRVLKRLATSYPYLEWTPYLFVYQIKEILENPEAFAAAAAASAAEAAPVATTTTDAAPVEEKEEEKEESDDDMGFGLFD